MTVGKTFRDIDLEKVLEGKPQEGVSIEDTVSRELRAEVRNIKTDERIKDAVIEFVCNAPHSLASFMAGNFYGFNLETAEELVKTKEGLAAATISYHNAAHVALFLATMKDGYDKKEAVKTINRFVEVARSQIDQPDWGYDPEASIYKWTVSHQLVAANIDEAVFILKEAIKNYKKRPDYEAKTKELIEYLGDYSNEKYAKIVKPEKIEGLNLNPDIMWLKVLVD